MNRGACREFGIFAFALAVATAGALAIIGSMGTASADELDFSPDSLAKAHAPLEQALPESCAPFQCLFETQESAERWIEAVADAPELTQAGGRPDLTSSVLIDPGGPPGESVRTIVSDLPAGATANPLAVPPCAAADFHLTLAGACPPASQVGVAMTLANELDLLSPVASLMPSPGQPALLGFKAFANAVILTPGVRNDGDYGLRVTSDGIPIVASFIGSILSLWGVPHDPVHDPQRFDAAGMLGGHVEGIPMPFLSAPTDCRTGPIGLTVRVRSWQRPEDWLERTSLFEEPTDCDQVPFNPSVAARPTTDVADSPSGLHVDLRMSQSETCHPIAPLPPPDQAQYDCGLAMSHLEDTLVRLPEGLSVNPAAANGLDGCPSSRVGLTTPPGRAPIRFDGKPADCPGSSWIGTAELDTPLLEQPVQGSVFLADPYDNPFGSLLALYVALEDRTRGIVVTLPGKVEADPHTGRLTVSFRESPQLPFERLRIDLKQGSHAPLRTPASCGSYVDRSTLTPYSAPDARVDAIDEWSITRGPGLACSESEASPNAPSFSAGAVSPVAGAYSPFVLRFGRAGGPQSLHVFEASLPPGLVAKLQGVARCPEALLATVVTKPGGEKRESPGCPAGSKVGRAFAGAGAGPSPYYAPGRVYMAGPYKGAPFSLAIVIPATAGPFDLGTVVVRVALHIDPHSVQITAVSDPTPSILEGIPLDLRTVELVLDREQFTKNGTSCDPSSVRGKVVPALGQPALVSSRFQLADCRQLPFRPRVAIRLAGGLGRNGHPALRAVIRPRPNEAGLASATFTLPATELLDVRRLRALCGREVPPEQCPSSSRLGYARLSSPILDGTLRGPIYARSPKQGLPGLFADLRLDRLHVVLNGRAAAKGGRLLVRFDGLPDVPFSRATFTLAGGRHGILVNSESLCRRSHRGRIELSAHNGKLYQLRPRLWLRGRC